MNFSWVLNIGNLIEIVILLAGGVLTIGIMKTEFKYMRRDIDANKAAQKTTDSKVDDILLNMALPITQRSSRRR